nr:xylulose kinase-1 [Tanacetum cinerariifolium]
MMMCKQEEKGVHLSTEQSNLLQDIDEESDNTDLQCWNIVQKGNSQKNITSDTEGNIIIAPPVTVEEHMQVQREEKVRTMLLTALPDEHIGDFYHMIDAKQIWSAIKARFGINAESTRMRRSLLKHQFEEYKASEEEGLDGGYDKMQKILPASALTNDSFVSSSSSSSSRSKLSYQETNGVGSSAKHSASKGSLSTQSSAIDDVIYSLIVDYEEDQHLAFEDLDQVNKEAFDEYEIKHQMEMIAIKAHKFEKKECRSHVSQEGTNYKNYKKKEAAKDVSESSALVVIDGSQGTNSTVPTDDVVPADAVPASAFISAEPT